MDDGRRQRSAVKSLSGVRDLQNAIDQSDLTTDLAKAYQSRKAFFNDVIQQPQGFNDKMVSDFLSAMNAFVDVALDLLDIIATVVLDLIDLMLEGLQLLSGPSARWTSSAISAPA